MKIRVKAGGIAASVYLGFFLVLFFYLEDGGDMFLWNVD
jgi:hypothetical protein